MPLLPRALFAAAPSTRYGAPTQICFAVTPRACPPFDTAGAELLEPPIDPCDEVPAGPPRAEPAEGEPDDADPSMPPGAPEAVSPPRLCVASCDDVVVPLIWTVE